MTTTTIRLSEELKARVNEAAKRTGTTAHGFILEAIAEKTALDERRADFREEAEDRYARIIASGKSIAWDDMRNYLKSKTSNENISLPKSRKLVR
jgi:predicted transcriptional regulator